MFNEALRKFLARDVYIQVFVDRIRVRNLINGQSLDETAPQTFSSKRLLIADFVAAQRHLANLFHRLYSERLFAPSPRALIHARERNDDGQSPVEERVLLELATAAGASQVFVHDGPELSDHAALELLAKRSRDA